MTGQFFKKLFCKGKCKLKRIGHIYNFFNKPALGQTLLVAALSKCHAGSIRHQGSLFSTKQLCCCGSTPPRACQSWQPAPALAPILTVGYRKCQRFLSANSATCYNVYHSCARSDLTGLCDLHRRGKVAILPTITYLSIFILRRP